MELFRLRELNLGCIQVDWSSNELSDVINNLPSSMVHLNVAGFRGIITDDRKFVF